ncbi:MAG: Vacuole effluxer Atg22 like protein [Firmicutes bacterium ADurb.Bin182]|nr:MAG: Vacuole effluxer Atg22 like protein [Firmicutes bacterium ADurb.Bin182]
MLKQFTKQEKSWIMYDWANSAYSILVASILPIYAGVVGGAAGIPAVTQTSHWAFVSSFSALIIALSAPVLGAVADYRGMRKRLFFSFFLVGVIATGLLPVTNSYVFLLFLYGITNFGFAGSNVFYDAFLMDVTTNERMNKVSSWGFAMGYIGGSTIPFLASIALTVLAKDGMVPLLPIDQTAAMKAACLITMGWWAVFTVPLLKNVKQVYSIEPEKGTVKRSFARLLSTVREVKKHRMLLVFLIAYFCYINGVGTIIMMASKLATSISMPDGSTGFGTLYIIGGLLITQVVAFPFSIIYDKLSKRFSTKAMILCGIITYTVICAIGFFMVREWQFLMLAGFVGTAQGGVQALSRAFFGKLIPDKNRSGEFFGFYNIFGKFESVAGTALMGLVLLFTDDVHYGIIPVFVLFILGGLLMLRVPEVKEAGGAVSLACNERNAAL